MVRIKICGLTRTEDVDAAVAAGADAIGFVFYPKSKRFVDIDCAKKLMARVPPFVVTVGLFVNEQPEIIESILSELPISLLQFHGDEQPEACERYHRPYIKAIRMTEQTNLLAEASRFSSAKGLLLDADSAGYGGAGKTFDWSMIPNMTNIPIILAGGLNQDNVKEAINMVKPYAVDVSSGVESQPGIKCHNKITTFVELVRQEQHSVYGDA